MLIVESPTRDKQYELETYERSITDDRRPVPRSLAKVPTSGPGAFYSLYPVLGLEDKGVRASARDIEQARPIPNHCL